MSKKVDDFARHYRSDIRYPLQRLLVTLDQRIEGSEMLGQSLRGGLPDIRNAQSIKEPVEGGVLTGLECVEKVGAAVMNCREVRLIKQP